MSDSSSNFDFDMVGVIEGTDKSSSHSYAWDYLRHYAELFAPFRDQPINFIEIGVARGASLAAWKSFFTKAHIIGIDIAPGSARFADDRVTMEIGSQDDPGFLAQVCAKYPPSIIIDDGSHRANHIMYTFERMFPSLLPGGVYVTEDMSFHFGASEKAHRGAALVSPQEYFLRIAKSSLAGSVQDAADAGTARYLQEQVDSVSFGHSFIVINKKPAARNVSLSLDFADKYLRDRKPDAGTHERIAQFILRHSGPLDRAESEIKQAITLDGETPRRLRLHSDIQKALKHLPEAADLAERAAALAKDAALWQHAGDIRMESRDFDGAVRDFREANSARPGHVPYLAKLSEALQKAGDVKGALTAAHQGLTASAGTASEAKMRQRADQLTALSR